VHFLYLDASALAKRYALEIGSPVINHLFANVPVDRFYVLSVGIAELVSILVRKKNAGHLTATEFAQAQTGVSIEIVPTSGPRKVDANTALAINALPLIAAHSINGTDALILRSALDLATSHRTDGDDLVLVASDQRLFRAAQVEGLITFNPETQDQTALAALLGP
jgi:hypothetical protein